LRNDAERHKLYNSDVDEHDFCMEIDYTTTYSLAKSSSTQILELEQNDFLQADVIETTTATDSQASRRSKNDKSR
jgi:hypothetical protein